MCMNRVVLGLAVALVLVGCSAKGGGGAQAKREPVTEAEFIKMMGVEPVAAMDWSARGYLSATPPMDGMLIDALADPFNEDAGWMKPDKKADREKMAKARDSWWEKTKGTREDSLTNEAVVSQFSIVIGARVLRSRLSAASGDLVGAIAVATETMEIAREGFLTAPGMVAADLMPTVVIASEGLAKLSQSPGVTDAQLDKALAAMDFSIFDRIKKGAHDDFIAFQLPLLVERLNRVDQAKAIVELVDPMGDSEQPIDRVEGAIKGHSIIDNGECAKAAKKMLERYSESPREMAELAVMSTEAEGHLTKTWGINLFDARPEEWPSNLGDSVKGSKNSVGELYLAAIEREWLAKIESSTMMQFSLDAARLSVMITRGHGKEPSQSETNVLVDPLTGGNYEIDYKNKMLRTKMQSIDPQFIFAHQLVENGVPY